MRKNETSEQQKPHGKYYERDPEHNPYAGTNKKAERDAIKKDTDADFQKEKYDAMYKAISLTMQIILSNELFESAARRGNGDFKSLIYLNIPMITESIFGRYQRILDEIVNGNSNL